MRKPIFYFDLVAGCRQLGGVSQYSQALLPHLHRELGERLLPVSTIAGTLATASTPMEAFAQEADIARSLAAAHDHAILLFPNFASPLERTRKPGIKVVNIVHDVQFKSCLQYYAATDLALLDTAFRQTRERADDVLFVSRATQADFVRHFGAPRRHAVIGAPVEATSTPRACAAHGSPPFLLATSHNNNHPHKNLPGLLALFTRMVEAMPNLRLRMTGMGGDRVADAVGRMPASIAARIEHLGFVPRAEIDALYASALAFVSLSEFEGFNLSAAEAAMHGTPLILSDIPVHRELCADMALFADEGTPAMEIQAFVARHRTAKNAWRLRHRFTPSMVAAALAGRLEWLDAPAQEAARPHSRSCGAKAYVAVPRSRHAALQTILLSSIALTAMIAGSPHAARAASSGAIPTLTQGGSGGANAGATSAAGGVLDQVGSDSASGGGGGGGPASAGGAVQSGGTSTQGYSGNGGSGGVSKAADVGGSPTGSNGNAGGMATIGGGYTGFGGGGGGGGYGVATTTTANAPNTGVVTGGTGGPGGVGTTNQKSGGGGVGGGGLILLDGGTITNSGSLLGGTGGTGGIGNGFEVGQAGIGGAGLESSGGTASAAATIGNTGTIAGGAGGPILDGQNSYPGVPGQGGAGVALIAAGSVTNSTASGVISGGQGGQANLLPGGTAYYAVGGSGGNGVDVYAGGTITNVGSAKILGGAGGSSVGNGQAFDGGNGGEGVRVLAGILNLGSGGGNAGTITGGAAAPGVASTTAGVTAGFGGNGGTGIDATLATSASLTNTGTISGGAGGNGGAGGLNGNAGGYGGAGILSGGGLTLTNAANSSIIGGAGGSGGDGSQSGGSGGSGNYGIVASGGGSIVNRGTIAGSNGGAAGPSGTGTAGAGDPGISFAGDGTITTSGAINGGLSGNGVTRSDAIDFRSGTHTLKLQTGATFFGQVQALSNPELNTLQLDGSSSGTVSLPQFVNFGHLLQSGVGGGAWMLTGTGRFTVDAIVSAGTLTLDPASVLNAPTLSILTGGTLSLSSAAPLSGTTPPAITLNGGTLQVIGATLNALPSANTFTFGNSGGFFDIAAAANTFTVADNLGGPGQLGKLGAGTLDLAGQNTYTGGTSLEGGTVAINNASALGTGTLFMSGGTTLAFLNSFTLPNKVVFVGLTADPTFDTGANIDTASGTISGADTLTKAGTGNLILTGNNTYSGGTTIAAGTLQLGNGVARSGSIVGNVANGGTLAFNRVDPVTFAGAISGTGIVNQIGTGVTTLSGASTYTGATNVNAGTLSVTGSLGATATTVVNGGTLQGTGTIGGPVTIQAGGILAPGIAGTINGIGTLSVGSLALIGGSLFNVDLSTPNVVGGAANDLIQDQGNLALGGTVNVADAGGFGNGTYRLINYAGALNNGNGIAVGTLPSGYQGVVQTAVAGQVNLVVTSPGVTTQYWDGNGPPNDGVIQGGTGTWNAANINWTTASGARNSPWASGFGIFTTTGGTVTVTDALSFRSLQFLTNGYDIEAAGGTLAPIGQASLRADPGVIVTIGVPLVGNGGITKNDAGTVVLTGANTYTGGTTISGGTLQLGNGGTTGSIVGNVLDNATLAFDRSDTVAFAGAISGGGAVTQIGPGTTVLTGANTFTGGTTIAAGTLQIGNGGTTGTIVGNIADNGTLAFARSDTFTFGDVISGPGAVIQTGPGTTVLSGANTYTGATTIIGGTLALAGTGSIAASSGLTNNATFDISASTGGAALTTLSGNGRVALGAQTLTVTAGSTSFAGTIDGTGGLTLTGGTQGLSGANTYTGATTIEGGTLALTGGGSITSSSGLIDNATFDISGTTGGAAITTVSGIGAVALGAQTLTVMAGSTTFAGAIGGSGGFAVAGGTQGLSGTNTYTGPTTIAGGTLALTGAGSIAASRGVTDNGSFDISGTTAGAAITTLSGTGAVALGARTLTVTAGSTTFAGTIGGSGGFAVAGGTQGLAGSINLALGTPGSIGLLAANGGVINASGTTTITGIGGPVTALAAVNDGQFQVTGPLTVALGDPASVAFRLTGNNAAISASGGGTVASGGRAISFENGTGQSASFTGFTFTNTSGDLIFADPAQATLTLTNSTANASGGNGVLLDVTNASTVALNANSSTLTGAILTDATSVSSVTLNNASVFNLTGNSNVTSLANNASTIAFAPPVNGVFKTLTTGSYTGAGGTIGLNTVLGATGSLSDQLIINGGTATGTTTLRITNAGGVGAATTGNGIEVIGAVNGATTAIGAFQLANRVVVNGYEYQLFRSGTDGQAADVQDYFLRSAPAPTGTAVQNSVNTLAQSRQSQIVTNRILGSILLGANEQISCYSCVSGFASAGSFAFGTHGRFDLTDHLTLLAGASVDQFSGRGYSTDASPIVAASLRYDFVDLGRTRPFVEAGGVVSPYQPTHYTRSYFNGIGTSSGGGTTVSQDAAGFGRAGIVSRLTPVDEFAAYGEFSHNWQHTQGYRETTNTNPFSATFAGGDDSTNIAKVAAQYTHLFGSKLEVNVNGGVVSGFGLTSGVKANVDPFGGFVGATPGSSMWVEYGGRLGYRLSPGTTLDGFVLGTLGPGPAGNTIHGGAGLRVAF